MSDNHTDLEEQEREEILEEIDKLVATNRLPVSEDMRKLTSQKSGIAFPLVINLFAVAAVISTFYFSNRLFEQKQETLSMENATYSSAEGKLLEELKKESAEKLDQKNREIGKIQNELAELDRQSRELADTMDQQIADREAELRTALEAELEEERAKLRSQGRTEADIEAQLKLIESQRSAEYEAELSAFRVETEAEIAAREEELALAKQLNEELLAEVNSEKERIESETRQRETELTARFEAEKAELAEEAASAAAALEQLSADREREALIIDQINGSYESIFDAINSGNSDEALNRLDALKKLIEDPAVATLKAVSSRSSNDMNTLEILRQRLEEQSYKDDTDTKSLAAAADLLLSAQELAELGTQAYNAGRTAEAGEYYSRSLEKIPALSRAVRNLDEISRTSEAEELAQKIDQASALAAAGDQPGAAARFAEAIRSAATYNPGLLEQALSGIQDSSDAYSSSRIAEVETETGQLRRRLEETSAALEAAETNYAARIAEAESAHEAELEKTAAEYEAALTEAAAEYEAQLAEATSAYEAQLAEAGSNATELETSKDEEIDKLTRLIGERDQANLALNSEKEETAARLATVQEELALKNTEIEVLNAAAEESAVEFEKQIEAAETKYKELAADISEQQPAEQTGYNRGVEDGRREAYKEIISFSSFLDGTSQLDSAAAARITEQAEEDPVYRQAVQKIQDIAAADSGISEAQSILVGTVSYASGDAITIEALTEQLIEPGTRITVKRKERGRTEYYVTFGIVTSVNGSTIRARTDPAGTEPARNRDLVYMTVTF